ncbi:P-loop containing nucleoside triphosphate hydrolase protein [Phlegmacium glaucopus]|nr:P-loop containing nucleoside triphosphate hydrolase protein [Phlegmacium glaucopus]
MEHTPSSSSPNFEKPSHYNSLAGHTLIRSILAQNQPIPIEPHDYQLEGICMSLDGHDVVATMATGSGKTGFFTFLMLVIQAISKHPDLAIGGKGFPKDPAMVVICPTKALQQDMGIKMTSFGLKTIVINSDTMALNRRLGVNLWADARDGYAAVLLSPEELASQAFADLLKHKEFFDRVCRLGIDEIHLIHWWGKSFRPAFQLIGHIRARLPNHRGRPISLLGVTATLREGPTLVSVQKVLGLTPGNYHLIRRSNMRHDIQIICCEMRSGLAEVFTLPHIVRPEFRRTDRSPADSSGLQKSPVRVR